MSMTRQGPVWALSLTTSAEAGDAAAELLLRTTGFPAVVTLDRRTGLSAAVVYLEDRHFCTAARRRALKEGVGALAACGLDVGPGRIGFRRVADRDWAESWKRHFRATLFARRLLVRPSWSRRRPRPGQVELVLDPGLSFGTGQHPTTGFCLEEVVRHRPRGETRSMLDVGTGSGILALAAAALGYAPVAGFDFDREAVRVAMENAERNGLAGRIRFTRGDVGRLGASPRRRHDLVCANLTADLLLAHAGRLTAQVKPGGVLVLAGILVEQFPRVQARFEEEGLQLERERARGEWKSGAFRRLLA